MTVPHIDICFVCGLIEGWPVSPALLGDDFLQFLWLDPLSSGAPRVHLPFQEWSVNRWGPTISHRKCAWWMLTQSPAPLFVYANSCLSRIYLTSREAHINGHRPHLQLAGHPYPWICQLLKGTRRDRSPTFGRTQRESIYAIRSM